MRKQALIPLIIGMVVGLAALKLGYDYVARSRSQQPKSGQSNMVVVAARPLSFGATLQEKDLKLADMPKHLIPEGAVSDPKELIGQTIKANLSAKMPVLKGMIGAGQGLASVIPVGYRAVSVKVDEFTGVAGLLHPGVHVDVVATLKISKGGARAETTSITILQNIEVRAVGRRYEEKDTELASKLSRSITLLLKPDQVETLQLATSKGKIRLALRSTTDSAEVSTKGTTLTKLLSHDLGLKKSKGADWLKLMQAALAERRPKVGSIVRKPRTEPYLVEVYVGDRIERLYFASADSDRRVTPLNASEDQSERELRRDEETAVKDESTLADG